MMSEVFLFVSACTLLSFSFTGRVCIPFNPDEVEDFNPENVPTVNQLAMELDEYAKEDKENSEMKDYDKTSLRVPMAIFSKFLTGLKKSQETKINF